MSLLWTSKFYTEFPKHIVIVLGKVAEKNIKRYGLLPKGGGVSKGRKTKPLFWGLKRVKNGIKIAPKKHVKKIPRKKRT